MNLKFPNNDSRHFFFFLPPTLAGNIWADELNIPTQVICRPTQRLVLALSSPTNPRFLIQTSPI